MEDRSVGTWKAEAARPRYTWAPASLLAVEVAQVLLVYCQNILDQDAQTEYQMEETLKMNPLLLNFPRHSSLCSTTLQSRMNAKLSKQRF